MFIGDVLRKRREELGMSIRELSRRSEGRPELMEYINPTYYCRIEMESSPYVVVANTTIDKFWTIGSLLRISPLLLFVLSRKLDPTEADRSFSIRDSWPIEFGQFIKERRKKLNLSLREISLLSEKYHTKISVGFLSQLETNLREQSSKVSGDKIWILGCILDVDPLLLYVLSRKFDSKYLTAVNRDKLSQ